jgi:hypothetical protein
MAIGKQALHENQTLALSKRNYLYYLIWNYYVGFGNQAEN